MTQKPQTRLFPYALASGIACLLALSASLLAPEPVRTGIVYGSASAALGALCGLSAIAVGARAGTTNGLLGAFAIGFLCRAVLVGLGLVASGVRGTAAIAYAAAFFGLFGVTQLVEILFVHASASKPLAGPAPAPASAER